MTRTRPASVVDEALAAGEVAGRRVARRVPALRRFAVRWVRRAPESATPLSLEKLRNAIIDLGYEPGRDLLVHSALIEHLEADLDEVIAMLRGLVGSRGTLLMPSHPLLTRQHNMMRVYDVQRSRSKVGLLSERFRKTPEVKRSRFPVAPVCAVGPLADAYVSDFKDESGTTAYGAGSPYHRLAERRGQALFLGIDFIRALTLEHVAFDLLEEEDIPLTGYHVHQLFWVVDRGEGRVCSVKRPRESLQRWLATAAMRRMVLRSGTIRERKLHGAPLALLDAGAFLRWHIPLARDRGWPYWTPPLQSTQRRR